MSVAALGVTSSMALADVSVDFENFASAGSQFTYIADGAALSGTLDSATGAFYLVEEGANWTYASDLTLLFFDADGAAVLQIGGWSTYADNKIAWGMGDSRDAGTWVDTTVAVGVDVTGLSVAMGNGYSSGGESYWTGNITMNGVEVPAPGALALLGLAGFASRRRRK